jgi:hypothetical protein
MEIIFSRYLYSLAMLRASSGYVTELRNARQQGNGDRCGELLKNVMDRLSNGAVRLLKMKAGSKFIFVRVWLTVSLG